MAVSTPATLLVPLLLLLARGTAGLKFSYRMKGSGPTQGINGAVVVIINQPIRSLIRDGIDTKIAPTVTYFLKATKKARVGYRATLFGATGTFDKGGNDTHAIRFAELAAGAAFPSKGFSGNAFDILPECSPSCGSSAWCYATNKCDCKQGTSASSCGPGGGSSVVCSPPCQNKGVCLLYNFERGGVRLQENLCVCDLDGGTGSGPDCSQPSVCSPVCVNGGVCMTRTYSNSSSAWQEAYCKCPVGSGTNPDCSVPPGRRLMADDEPQAIKALAHSLKTRPAKVGPTATDAEKMWDKLEGLMTRLCDGDIGATVVKDSGSSPPILVKLPWIYKTYYC